MIAPYTLDDVGSLPLVLTSAELAGILRCDADHLYDLNRRGALPFKPILLGRKLIWPTAAVLRGLGVELPVGAVEQTADREVEGSPGPLRLVALEGP